MACSHLEAACPPDAAVSAACILTTARGKSTQPAAAAPSACTPTLLPCLPPAPPTHAPQAKAAGGSHPKVKFNRLLLRFGSLHEGFAACRTVFAQWAGSDEGELSEARLRDACSTLGYTLDAATLDKIFVSADMDASNTLNQYEFLVVLAILHILKVGALLLGCTAALHCWDALLHCTAALRCTALLHCTALPHCIAALHCCPCFAASDDAAAREVLALSSMRSAAGAAALDCTPTRTRPEPCLPARLPARPPACPCRARRTWSASTRSSCAACRPLRRPS